MNYFTHNMEWSYITCKTGYISCDNYVMFWFSHLWSLDLTGTWHHVPVYDIYIRHKSRSKTDLQTKGIYGREGQRAGYQQGRICSKLIIYIYEDGIMDPCLWRKDKKVYLAQSLGGSTVVKLAFVQHYRGPYCTWHHGSRSTMKKQSMKCKKWRQRNEVACLCLL